MLWSSAVCALAALPCLLAAPTVHLAKRQNNDSDITILNYALTLEHLEAHFYTQGLNQYNVSDFEAANFTSDQYDLFETIQEHESTHVSVLQSIITSLGGTPVPECEYNFPYTSVSGFVAIARALETTGVTAYDGVVSGVTNKDIQTDGATIATVEARHAAFLNLITGHTPFPDAFDSALGPREIVSIAADFIKSCPYDLGVKPFPKLVLYPSSAPAGQYVTLVPTGLEANATTQYCSLIYGATQLVTPLLTGNLCQVPQNVTGDVFVFLLDSNSTVSIKDDSHVVSGPGIFTVTEPQD